MSLRVGDLFTGLGGFSLAVKNIIPDSEVLFWSEIDKFSIKTYEKNFPTHRGINLGDISRVCFDLDKNSQWETNEFRVSLLPDIDLLVGGSPCTDLSIAKGKREGLLGSRSSLFFAFSEIIKIKRPKFFLLENVASMPKEARDMISTVLGVEPVEINSDLFTPQKRRRLYWFNWDLPVTKMDDVLPSRWPELVAWSSSNDYENGKHLRKRERETRDGRANTLTTGPGCSSFSSKNFIIDADGERRLLHPHEAEELQGLPHGWTAGVSDSQRFKQIGNAVTVPVIEYLLRGIKGPVFK